MARPIRCWKSCWYDTAICHYRGDCDSGGVAPSPEHFAIWFTSYPYAEYVDADSMWARMEWWRNRDHFAATFVADAV
jgi:hypothetical protein